jgi:hypothetical protein
MYSRLNYSVEFIRTIEFEAQKTKMAKQKLEETLYYQD